MHRNGIYLEVIINESKVSILNNEDVGYAIILLSYPDMIAFFSG